MIYSLSHPHFQPIRKTMARITSKLPTTMTAMAQVGRGGEVGVGGTKQQNKNYFVTTVNNGKMKVTFGN